MSMSSGERATADPDPERAQKIADHELIMELFAGRVDQRGRVAPLKHNDPREKLARAALARYLRAAMPCTLVREFLAMAIDPDTRPTIPDNPTRPARRLRPSRKIVFQAMGRGASSTGNRDLAIVQLIERSLSEEYGRLKTKGVGGKPKLESAIALVCQQYPSIKRSRVQAIWKKYNAAATGKALSGGPVSIEHGAQESISEHKQHRTRLAYAQHETAPPSELKEHGSRQGPSRIRKPLKHITRQTSPDRRV